MSKKSKGKAPIKSTEAAPEARKSKADVLLSEIIALGGDEKDLEIVQGLDSDAENGQAVASTSQSTKAAKAVEAKELAKFVAGLGFDKLQRAEIDTESEQESATESEENEDSPDENVQLATSALAKADTPAASASKPLASSASSVWLVSPQPIWHAVQLPTLPKAPESFVLTAQTSTMLESRGQELLEAANTQYTESLSPSNKAASNDLNSTLSRADKSFIVGILKSGTSSDKLSALTLLASSSPIHCTSYLTQLLALCSKKNREESTKALRSVVDWLKGQGLPKDRKLKFFVDHGEDLRTVAYAQSKSKLSGLDSRKPGDEHLLVWTFEAWLKKWYVDLLRVLETMTHDPLPFIRTQVVNHLQGLLTEKPEQEHNLLRLLVNKLGDVHRPLSSATSHHLLQVLQIHPMMKTIIVKEIAQLVLKPLPAVSDDSSQKKYDHGRYYGIITLNQIMLTRIKDQEVARKMIDVYFAVFGDVLKSIDSAKDAVLDVKVKKGKNQKSAEKKRQSNAVEKAEHEEEGSNKMLAAVLTGVNRAFPFADLQDDVLQERMDILFRITHTGSFNVSVQALQLVFTITNAKQSMSDRFYRALYESLLDARLSDSSKQTLYLNLLFKAINIDSSTKRIMAFVKRLLQSLAYHQVPYVIGSLYLLGELFRTKAALRSMLLVPEEDNRAEIFNDQPERLGGDEAVEADTAVDMENSPNRYDARKRDPQFANAHLTCLWELTPLLNHYHPSVCLHAAELLQGQDVSADQDLEQHTLSHFLDRFVYRDPKKASKVTRGVSAMQPAATGQDRNGRVLKRKGAGLDRQELANSELFWRQNLEDVPVDQAFFHHFFTNKHDFANALKVKADLRRSKKRPREDDENEEEGSAIGSDDEEEIWQAMKASMPKAGDFEEEEDEDDDLSLEDDISATEEEEESASGDVTKAPSDENEDDESEHGFSAFEEDEDDLVHSDSDLEDIVLGSEPEAEAQATRADGDQSKSRKKRKLKHLPTFATADDYAHLLGGSDDEDV